MTGLQAIVSWCKLMSVKCTSLAGGGGSVQLNNIYNNIERNDHDVDELCIVFICILK